MSIGLPDRRFRLTLLLAAWGLFFCVDSSPAAQSNNFNLRSSDFPVEVTSANPEYGGLVLELLDHSFQYFSATMGIKSFEPMRFRFVLEDTPPTESNQEMESRFYPRTVSLDDKMEFRVRIPSSDFNPVAVVRTAMICQLQAYVLKNKPGDAGGQVPAPPFWLMEGLTQGLLDKKTPSLEKIIARIDRVGPAPTLKAVQDWDDPSPHRLEQWWEEACCYWLVQKATVNSSKREALCAWLQQTAARGDRPYWDDTDENEAWWKKSLGERSREKVPLHGEEQTREELDKCLQFKAVLKGETETKEYNLAKLPKPPLEFTSSKPFEEVMARLFQLQTRGNLLWQDVIESYRNAYSFWLKGKYVDYQKEIAKAESKAQSVTDYMTKTRDYLNWYEVNHPASGPKFSTLLRQSLAFEDARDLKKRDQAGIESKLTLIEGAK